MKKIIISLVVIILFPNVYLADGAKVKVIKLVWFNYKNDNLNEYLTKLLEYRFNAKVQTFYTQNMPEKAYVPSKKQHNAEYFIQILEEYKENKCIVLGIVDVDLYIEGFNFIFGLANPSEKIAVIGLERLKQQFYGLKEDLNLFYKRAGKEAVHEIGHLLGLSHCKNEKCVMHFSNTLNDTDIKDDDFCEKCKEKI